MRVLVVEDEAAVAKRLGKGGWEQSGFRLPWRLMARSAWFRGDTEDFTAGRSRPWVAAHRWVDCPEEMAASGRASRGSCSQRGSWKERVDGIDAGADDYLPKLFRWRS